MSDSLCEPRLIPARTAGILLLALLLGGVTLAYPAGGGDIPTYSYIASVVREGSVGHRYLEFAARRPPVAEGYRVDVETSHDAFHVRRGRDENAP